MDDATPDPKQEANHPESLSPDIKGVNAPRFALKLAAAPNILPDDAMSEAGRKILFHQFEILLKHEPGVRTGHGIDAVHDMRVATRRTRSAIQVFEPFYKKGSMIGVFERSIKNLGSALGGVRDLDVFKQKVDHYAAELPPPDQEGLHAFRDHFDSTSDKSRQTLLALLDSNNFRDFVGTYHEFLTTPGAGSIAKTGPGKPHLVRHVVPLLIYEQYTTMRTYETILGVASLDTLHQLRTEAKRLRYLLEFFAEVLGSETKLVIAAIKSLQDHLGDLQDARIAADILQGYLKKADERSDMRPVLRYLSNRENEKQRLLNTVNEAWAAFIDPKIRKALANTVSAL